MLCSVHKRFGTTQAALYTQLFDFLNGWVDNANCVCFVGGGGGYGVGVEGGETHSLKVV